MLEKLLSNFTAEDLPIKNQSEIHDETSQVQERMDILPYERPLSVQTPGRLLKNPRNMSRFIPLAEGGLITPVLKEVRGRNNEAKTFMIVRFGGDRK